MAKFRKLIAVAALAFIGLPLSFLPADAGTTTYKYDAKGRVIEIDYPNGAVVKYSYDNAGNRTQMVKTP